MKKILALITFIIMLLSACSKEKEPLTGTITITIQNTCNANISLFTINGKKIAQQQYDCTLQSKIIFTPKTIGPFIIHAANSDQEIKQTCVFAPGDNLQITITF